MKSHHDEVSTIKGFRPLIVKHGLAAVDSAETRRATYELFNQLLTDVPSVDTWQLPPFEQYARTLLEGPAANLETFILAQAGNKFIGLSYMLTSPNRPAYNQFTGVHPDYRGKGIALVLKAQAILYARTHGIPEIRTNNHTGNAPMLAVNARLGYRRLPGRIIFGRRP